VKLDCCWALGTAPKAWIVAGLVDQGWGFPVVSELASAKLLVPRLIKASTGGLGRTPELGLGGGLGLGVREGSLGRGVEIDAALSVVVVVGVEGEAESKEAMVVGTVAVVGEPAEAEELSFPITRLLNHCQEPDDPDSGAA
jgi:hypothetical protein